MRPQRGPNNLMFYEPRQSLGRGLPVCKADFRPQYFITDCSIEVFLFLAYSDCDCLPKKENTKTFLFRLALGRI